MNPINPFGSSKKEETNLSKSFPIEINEMPKNRILLNNRKNGRLVICMIIKAMKATWTNTNASIVHSGKNSKTFDKSKNTDEIVTRLTYILWLNAVNGDNEKYAEEPMTDEVKKKKADVIIYSTIPTTNKTMLIVPESFNTVSRTNIVPVKLASGNIITNGSNSRSTLVGYKERL